jgi:hypothetical protein
MSERFGDKFGTKISITERFGDKFGTKISITDLESQVQHTSTEIMALQENFTHQLASIQQSVESLSCKGNLQCTELSTAVQTLTDTIAKHNFIIVGIQQEFKHSFATLTESLLPLSPPFASSTRSLQKLPEAG